MSRPWMPLYVAEFMGDTSHLSAAETGAYLMLIMHYWRAGSLPSDNNGRQRISRMTPQEWRHSEPTLRSFFDADWRHKRIEIEIAKSSGISEKRRMAAIVKHSGKNVVILGGAK